MAIVKIVGCLAFVGAILGVAVPCQAQNALGHVPGRILVRFHEGTTLFERWALASAADSDDLGQIPHTGIHVLQVPEGRSEEAVARAFARRPEVEFAELDELLAPSGDTIPNDGLYASQWHLKKIGCPTAWSTTTGSAGVTIAILDSGVDGTHPDLAAKMIPGWNFFDGNADTADVFGHGTAVAGTAAASSNNLSGVASVAWNCRIMPIRISDLNGMASTSRIASGLTWAADNGARVANVSYACSGSSVVASAAQYFQSKGGVVVVSAGNDGTTSVAADNPFVLTVSATDPNDALYSWSTRGSNLDLAAPGNVYTTTRGGGYGSWSGTSFSAPIVAGVAALAISANPTLTAVQVQDTLIRSSDDLGATGWDGLYGYGRVNAFKAVTLATGGVADSTAPSVSFVSPGNGATLGGSGTVSVAATDNVAVTSVAIYLDGVLQTTLTASPYSVSWDTTKVTNGAHGLKAVAIDAAGNIGSTEISLTVNNPVDTTAPTVAITSPTTGALSGNTLAVTASASDNVGVARVELWVDGKLSLTDSSAPYSFSVNSRNWKAGSSHTLVCRAYDAAGNVAISATVTVKK